MVGAYILQKTRSITDRECFLVASFKDVEVVEGLLLGGHDGVHSEVAVLLLQ